MLAIMLPAKYCAKNFIAVILQIAFMCGCATDNGNRADPVSTFEMNVTRLSELELTDVNVLESRIVVSKSGDSFLVYMQVVKLVPGESWASAELWLAHRVAGESPWRRQRISEPGWFVRQPQLAIQGDSSVIISYLHGACVCVTRISISGGDVQSVTLKDSAASGVLDYPMLSVSDDGLIAITVNRILGERGALARVFRFEDAPNGELELFSIPIQMNQAERIVASAVDALNRLCAVIVDHARYPRRVRLTIYDPIANRLVFDRIVDGGLYLSQPTSWKEMITSEQGLELSSGPSVSIVHDTLHICWITSRPGRPNALALMEFDLRNLLISGAAGAIERPRQRAIFAAFAFSMDSAPVVFWFCQDTPGLMVLDSCRFVEGEWREWLSPDRRLVCSLGDWPGYLVSGFAQRSGLFIVIPCADCRIECAASIKSRGLHVQERERPVRNQESPNALWYFVAGEHQK